MAVGTLHDVNQRYIRLTDRCRSQWTFYQLLHGIFKHLRDEDCPLELDYQAFFQRLREIGQDLAHPDAARIEKAFKEVAAQLDKQALCLLQVDATVSPSLLRRFVDRLRTQDEKVLLAIVKFYLDSGAATEDALDKMDLLFTRLAEIPRSDGGTMMRETHEIERLVQPLLAMRADKPVSSDEELDILLHAISELRGEILRCRSFTELMSSGALDRFRTFKRRLGESLLDPRLLPAVLDTTIGIKNRFRQLWEDEETQILDDTNRVRELQRQLAANPEIVSAELRDAMERFTQLQGRFDRGRQENNVRREDLLQLRRTMNEILEQFDAVAQPIDTTPPAPAEPEDAAPDGYESRALLEDTGSQARGLAAEVNLPADPLLVEHLTKIAFAIELVGRDVPTAQAVQAKELATLRLEECEVAAFQRMLTGTAEDGTLLGERDRLLATAAALRVRMDEEAREIDRLQKRGSDRLGDLLEHASQSLLRAAEVERRFVWLVEDALYRGETGHLEALYRCRFRLLRAYSGLWLIHNDRGGTSPF